MYVAPEQMHKRQLPLGSEYLGEDSKNYYYAVPTGRYTTEGYDYDGGLGLFKKIKKKLKKAVKSVVSIPKSAVKAVAPLLKQALPLALPVAAGFIGGPMAAMAAAGPLMKQLSSKTGKPEKELQQNLDMAMQGYTPEQQQLISYRATPQDLEYMAQYGQVPPQLAQNVREGGMGEEYDEAGMFGMGSMGTIALFAIPAAFFVFTTFLDRKKR